MHSQNGCFYQTMDQLHGSVPSVRGPINVTKSGESPQHLKRVI